MVNKQIVWVDSNNNQFNFDTTNGVKILRGIKGFFMPPFSFSEDEVPFVAGSNLRNIKVATRELELPVVISGSNEVDFMTKMRSMMNTFNPMNGNGKIRCISYDGSQREINCRYYGGFEMDENAATDTRQTAIGVFRAFDPYWYDTSTIIQTFTTGQPATFFPFFPLRLSSSTVFTDTSINNTGDVETCPTWVITGPGNSIYLRNLTTGEIININVTLGIGETIAIDTRQGKKTVTKGDGTNLYQYLSSDSSLWALQKGTNNIRIEMQNATTQSSVNLSYQNRYWSS
jgi:phage-related protein